MLESINIFLSSYQRSLLFRFITLGNSPCLPIQFFVWQYCESPASIFVADASSVLACMLFAFNISQPTFIFPQKITFYYEMLERIMDEFETKEDSLLHPDQIYRSSLPFHPT